MTEEIVDASSTRRLTGESGRPVLDLVIPVYNEQAILADSVHRLHAYATDHLPFAAQITIVDNGSADATPVIAAQLAAELDGVRVIRLEDKGRGGALRAAWLSSDAPILAYTDADLSTDLSAIPPLIEPLLSGQADIAIGNRLTRESSVVRGIKRELISRSYNRLLHMLLRTRFDDAQCGFKAIRADVARELLPRIADTGWFFDTELLVLAERTGLRIREVPVAWVDNPDSRVRILATAAGDLRGIARLRRTREHPTGSGWALAALLVSTAMFWLIGLGRNGWANPFYAAAVQAGTRSWKAALFGSSDAANSITVDKPPASLWPMELSARLFGLNSWSMLAPQVLIGVAAVALLYGCVKRTFGTPAGLIAGALLALTPVATLMFRYNNPDALLVLLMVLAAWALLRAVADGRTRWMVICGAAMGWAFLVKQLQVMLIAPALAGTYLYCGPPRLVVRVRQLVAAAAVMLVSAGWWVLLVSVTPPSNRPYIGGSTDNSFLNLTFGYNGLSRLTGHRPAGQSSPEHWGSWTHSHPGPLRLFTGESAGQVSWLLPLAVILLGSGLIWCGREPRTDLRRAHYLLWGGWLLVGGAVFSAMSGTYHDYYTVALAPALAALVAVGGTEAWRRRDAGRARLVLACGVAATGLWSWVLLSRTAGFAPGLRWLVIGSALVAAAVIAVPKPMTGVPRLMAAAAAVVTLAAGPLAYCIQTVTTAHHGGIVNAGPQLPQLDGSEAGQHHPQWGLAQPVSADVAALLDDGASSFTWVAATQGANQAAGYQLATGHPVMPIGGFIGRDPSPTLETFRNEVVQGRIHYFIDSRRPDDAGQDAPKDPADGPAAKIADWVRNTFAPHTVGGVTMYDLSGHAVRQ